MSRLVNGEIEIDEEDFKETKLPFMDEFEAEESRRLLLHTMRTLTLSFAREYGLSYSDDGGIPHLQRQFRDETSIGTITDLLRKKFDPLWDNMLRCAQSERLLAAQIKKPLALNERRTK